MEASEKEALKVEVYRRLMRYMEGLEKVPPAGIFVIPVTIDGVTRDLRFRRLAGLNQLHSAQSLDDPDFRVFYDPNWESMDKIERLLGVKV